MRLTWMVFASLLGVAWSIPTRGLEMSLKDALFNTDVSGGSTRNSQLEGVLLDLLETLRDITLHGSGDIPVLDPLKIDRLDLNDDVIPLPGARVSLGDAIVNHLSTFEVERLSINFQFPIRYRVLLDIKIPQLEASADQYDLDISALGFNIYGTGDLKLRIREPRISINFLIRPSLIGGIFLDIMESTVRFNLSTFEPEITGLFGHAGASDFVNLFLKDLVPTLVEVYEAEITQFLSTNVQVIANEILADLNLADLLS